MKTTNSQKIKIGAFTIAGILLFVAGIFLIGSKKNMFGNTYMIYGTFKNVGGLEVGNNIRFSGINVGTVEDIRIVSDTMIRVDMLMKEKVKPFLKTDALASIGSDGLVGDKLITITPGSANEVKLLSGGSRIRTVNPLDFDRVLNQFTNVAANAEVITRELAGMAVQIREGNGTISKLLYTDDLSRSLEGTARNAENITGSLAGIASHIRAGKGSVGHLIYTDSLSDALQRAGSTANGAMLTIQEGANGFSENMKALQSSYFLRGYFKRKAKEEAANPKAITTAIQTEGMDEDMDEQELKDIIADAQKALDAKKAKKK
jgi:phospholipid/cholesterol/gamma-HCH transport system substrate-binding protein